MLDTGMRILSPAFLLGLLAYAAVTALWLQPVVESRLAERTYIPLCEASLRDARRATDAQAQAEITQQRRSLDILRQIERDFGIPLPGMEYVEDALQQTLAPPSGKKSRSFLASPCGCAVGAVFDSIRLNMLFHVMSGRIYRPAALETVPASVLHEAAKAPCAKMGGN